VSPFKKGQDINIFSPFNAQGNVEE